MGATLTLNNGNFFANMKSAVSAANNLKNTLNGTSAGIKNFGSQSSGVGGVMTSLASKAAAAVGAFVGIRQAVNFGKDVVNTGVQFEQGMANVSAISGVTGAELTALSDKAKEMGATTKFSALEASDAMSYMAMAGWNSSQMIDGIGGIMNLAAASGEELASVSDIVTDSLTAFGLKASDSAEFADILAVASSKSNTNISLLGESFKNVAPTAGAMGYSVRDTTVALGLMANAGIKGGAAGTALNGVMTRLAKPTKEVNAAMSALGLSAVNADGSMKPLSQFIPELQAKFSSLTESEKGQYATMIAGKNAMSGFLSIVNSSPEDFQLLTDAINNSEGAAQSMADTMNDTVAGKLTLLKSQFEGVKIAIYDALGSSQFKGVLQSVSDGLTAVSPVLETVTVAIGNGLFAAIQGVYNIAVNVFNALKTAIENNQPAIENLKNAFENVKTSVMNAFGGESSGIITTLANVIVPGLANGLSALMNMFAGVASHLNIILPIILGIKGAMTAYKIAVTAANVVEGIRNGLIAFSAVMTGTQAAAFAPLTTATIAQIAATQALNVVTSAFGAIMTFVTSPIGLVVIAIGAVIAIGVLLYKHWDTVKQWAGNLWNGIKNIFSGIKNTISGAWDSVKEKASAVWSGIKNTVSEKVGLVKSAVSEKLAPVKEVFGNVMNAAKSVVSDRLNNIKSAYEQHGGGIKGAAFAAMEGVKGYYTAGYDFINNLTGGKLIEVVEGVKTKLSPMVNSVKEKLSGVKEAFSNAFSNAINFIKTSYNEGALKPIVDKVVSVFGTVKNAIAAKFTGIKEAVSAKFSAISDATNGVKEKIADKFTTAKTAISEKFTGIKEAVGVKLTVISEAANGIKEKIAEKFTAIKDAVVLRFGEIKTGIQTVLAPVINIVSTVVTGIKTVIITVIEGIKTHISNTVNIIKTTVMNIVEGVKQNFINFFASIQTSFQGIWSGITTVFEGIKTVVIGVFQTIVGIFTLNTQTIKTGVNTIKDGFMTAFEGIKTIVLNVWNAITSAADLAFNNVKTIVTNVIDGIKGVIESLKTTFSNVFDSVKTTVSNVFDSIKTTISNVWDGIKGIIKAPHIEVAGTMSIAGIDTPIPKLSLKWYAQGGIMTRPTIFGMNGGSLLGGGEAGAEAVLPLNTLWSELRQFADKIAQNNSEPATAVTNNIYVTVPNSGDDEDLPNKVARRIVEVLNNL